MKIKGMLVSFLGMMSLSSGVYADGDISYELLLTNTKVDFFNEKGVGIRAAYHINDNFALEGAYIRHGKHSESISDSTVRASGDATLQSFDYGLKGTLPFNGDLNLHARAGLSSYKVELSAEKSNIYGDSKSFSSSGSGTDPYFGLGASYDINDNVFAGVEYRVIDGDAKTVGASIGYKF